MNSSAFQRFMQGEDELSALLRAALPAFEAPPGMEARFRDQVQALQAGRAAAVEAMSFEPPASQSLAFARLAADVQSAQAPRRAAVLGQIRSGRSAAEVLGAAISEEGRAWLQQQSTAVAAPAAATAGRPAARRSAWTWGAGSAFASLLLMVVGLRVSGVWPAGGTLHREYSGEVVAASQSVASLAGAQLAQLDEQYPSADAAPEAAVAPAPRMATPQPQSRAAAGIDDGAARMDRLDTARREYAAKPSVAPLPKEKAVANTEELADQAVTIPAPAAPPPAQLALNENTAPAAEMAAAPTEPKRLPPAAEVAGTLASRSAAKRVAPLANGVSDAGEPPLQAGERLVLLRNRPAAAAMQLLADMPELGSVTVSVSSDDAVHQRWVAEFRAALLLEKPGLGVLHKRMPALPPDRVLISPHAAAAP